MTVRKSWGRRLAGVMLVAAACVSLPAGPAVAAGCRPVPAVLNIFEDQVVAGDALSGGISLSCAAGVAGLTVSVSSSDAAVMVPSSATIPPGDSWVEMPISTRPVAWPVTATVSVRYGTVTLVDHLTVLVAPPGFERIESLVLSPFIVHGGEPSTATVTLGGAAPAGGVTVALADDSGLTSVPASVMVSAGQRSADFTIATAASSGQTQVSYAAITATVGGGGFDFELGTGDSKTALLYIYPPRPPAGIWVSSLTLNPSTVTGGQSSTATIQLNTATPATVHVYIYRCAYGPTGAPATVSIGAGRSTASFTIATASVMSPISCGITAEVQGTDPAAAYLLVQP
jgi:hypothetical protein